MKKVTDAEWQEILKQSPTNEDLRYIIACTSKKDEAWEQLLKQSPTNDELLYIIEYTSKKDEAQALLDSRSKSVEKKEVRMMDIIRNR